MGATSIEWTARWTTDGVRVPGYTFNAWWGCEKVSPACKFCYADTWAKRTGWQIWGKDAPRRFFGPKHWLEPLKWNREAARLGVSLGCFCQSMGDLFEFLPGEMGKSLDDGRSWLWPLIYRTPRLEWMLLTKRPENVLGMVPRSWRYRFPRNVMMGVTAENQEELDRRLSHLAAIPAAVRFLSCEPLLGPLSILGLGNIVRLVIAGAESGARSKVRAMDEDWVRSLRDQSSAEGIDFFYKQKLDDKGRVISLPLLDGERHQAIPRLAA